MGLLRNEDDHPRSVWDGFKENFNGKILEDFVVTPGEQDLVPFLLRAKSKKIKNIGICVGPGQSSLIARQAQQLGIPLSLFGCETLDDRDEVKDSPGLNGTWFTSIGVSETFRSLYGAKFSDDTLIGGAAVHFDIAHLLSILSSDSSSKDSLMGRLLKLNGYHGANGDLGIVCAISRCHFQLPQVIKTIKDGKIIETPSMMRK